MISRTPSIGPIEYKFLRPGTRLLIARPRGPNFAPSTIRRSISASSMIKA
ncbi:Uncharacterised protein [Mycobacterium tuberculosis]|nr:Uncharacterised protein [Mycobacterium tuberculosis]